jgi:hypothetical protein
MEVAEGIVAVDMEAVDMEAVDMEAVDMEAEDEAEALEVQDHFDQHQLKLVTNMMSKLNQ